MSSGDRWAVGETDWKGDARIGVGHLLPSSVGDGFCAAKDVGFIDMPSNLDSKKHRALISASTKNANAILGDDAAEHWREVAFRFPPTLSRLIPDHWWRVGT
mgnify:CR=1 FL=1